MLILLLTLSFAISAQNELATICDNYNLIISAKELIKANRIEIKNNSRDFKISGFILHANTKGYIDEYKSNSDKLTNEMDSILTKILYGESVFIYNIIAINPNKDTIQLNPIQVKIGNCDCSAPKGKCINVFPKITGKNSGTINKSELIKADRIELWNNTDSLQIKSIDWSAISNIRLYAYPQINNSDKFNKTIIWYINEAKNIRYVYFYNIIASDKLQNEFVLPSIFLKIKND